MFTTERKWTATTLATIGLVASSAGALAYQAGGRGADSKNRARSTNARADDAPREVTAVVADPDERSARREPSPDRENRAIIELKLKLKQLAEETKRMGERENDRAASADSDGMSPAEWLKRIQGSHITYYAGFATDADTESSPEDDAKTRAILDALKKRVPMTFTEETPLAKVIDYIKTQTIGKDLPQGIPIYLDRTGFLEVEKTPESPITLDLKDVALRESLRLVLNQLGLTYFVKNGLLSIGNEWDDDPPTPIDRLADKARRGELSLREMKDLRELFKIRAEILRYSNGGADQENPPANIRDLNKAAETEPAADLTADARDDARTKAILAALNKAVPLQFKAATLEDVIKQIKKATFSPELPEGIPVYIAPDNQGGVGGMGGPFTPPLLPTRSITIELKGVKLKTSLRLMLHQINMAYVVKEGLLIIAQPGSPEIGFGGMGGMGGGMGGMGGGMR